MEEEEEEEEEEEGQRAGWESGSDPVPTWQACRGSTETTLAQDPHEKTSGGDGRKDTSLPRPVPV